MIQNPTHPPPSRCSATLVTTQSDMENELEHLKWNIEHALQQLEGPLSGELRSFHDISPTSPGTSVAVYQKLLDVVQALDKLLLTLTPSHMLLVDGVFGTDSQPLPLAA